MEPLIMIAVLATDPIRFVVAGVAVLILNKKGLKSILIAGTIAAISMELLMQAAGSSSLARLFPAFAAGVLQAGIVYGAARLLGWTKKPEVTE